MRVKTLADINSGKLKITSVDQILPCRERLEELGFAKGAIIEKLYVGCCGSPIAARVCGAVIAVRKADAKLIRGCPIVNGEVRS